MAGLAVFNDTDTPVYVMVQTKMQGQAVSASPRYDAQGLPRTDESTGYFINSSIPSYSHDDIFLCRACKFLSMTGILRIDHPAVLL